MVTKELVEYIQIETAKGISQAGFSARLKENGWTDEDIAEALTILNEVKFAAPNSVPRTESEAQKTETTHVPLPPSGKIRDYFAHFSAGMMFEFLVGAMIFLWQISSLTYITYFSILDSSINVTDYLLHFFVLVLGIALLSGAARLAQRRYINAIVGKRNN